MNKFAIGVIASLLPVTAAQAATISDSDSYGPALTEITSSGSINPLGNTVNAQPLELDMFDGALGTLNSVTVTLAGDFTSAGTVVNGSASDVTAQASETVEFIFNSDMFSTTQFGASDNTGFTDFAPGAIGTAVDFAGDASMMAGGLNVGDFIGAAGDTFMIDFATLVETSFLGGGGNLDFFVETMASVEATVVYDYDAPIVPPVPLPASLPLLLAGIAGVGLVARRRRG